MTMCATRLNLTLTQEAVFVTASAVSTAMRVQARRVSPASRPNLLVVLPRDLDHPRDMVLPRDLGLRRARAEAAGAAWAAASRVREAPAKEILTFHANVPVNVMFLLPVLRLPRAAKARQAPRVPVKARRAPRVPARARRAQKDLARVPAHHHHRPPRARSPLAAASAVNMRRSAKTKMTTTVENLEPANASTSASTIATTTRRQGLLNCFLDLCENFVSCFI